MAEIATDLFILQGVTYLLVVDYFSRFPEVITLTETSSSKVISSLKSMFSRYGVPETLLSDNGPQFASHEFDEFANAYEFTHITSSPHYPQSNGLAEQTVKTVKKLLKLAEDLHVYGIT
jgi:transposase InsO family protein